MDLEKIKSSLQTSWLGEKIHFEKSVDSTNQWAKRASAEGGIRGELFLADIQTAGHGRQNRVWESAAGKNILMSFLDRWPANQALLAQLTLVAGVALHDGLHLLFPSLTFRLKWPNDLLLNGKKIAGILCETAAKGQMAVIGIGINVNQPAGDFSPEVGRIAASLSDELKEPQSREILVAACLNAYEKRRNEYDRSGFPLLRKAWLEKTDMIGQKVRVVDSEKTFEGTADNLDENGFLVVDGKKIVSGDVVLCS